MASIVGGFCLPHDPLITALPDAAPKDAAGRVRAAFEEVRKRIADLGADTVIVTGDDHYAMFSPSCQPSILIGIGDLEGPLEPEAWLKIPRRAVANNCALAEHIMTFGFARGFDWAVAKTLVLDHSTMVPLHLAVPEGVRAIPIYVASGMMPLIRGQRCIELGRMIGQAVAAWPGDERVVILGTGGISHWVGMADAGRINPAFDRRIIDIVERGDIGALADLSEEEIIADGGNGGLEVRNWIIAMAAMPGANATMIAYEPVESWITGLGFAELAIAA